MGADMLVAYFYEINDKKIKPRWKKGFRFIQREYKKWVKQDSVPNAIDHLGFPDQARDYLTKALTEIQNGYEGQRRDLNSITIEPYTIYITGGMSWGEEPTELFNFINDLNELEILEICGFNPVINYKGIVDSILKGLGKSLTLLIGLDTTLDDMLAAKMRKRK